MKTILIMKTRIKINNIIIINSINKMMMKWKYHLTILEKIGIE
jgi:hypothetical protein